MFLKKNVKKKIVRFWLWANSSIRFLWLEYFKGLGLLSKKAPMSCKYFFEGSTFPSRKPDITSDHTCLIIVGLDSVFIFRFFLYGELLVVQFLAYYGVVWDQI